MARYVTLRAERTDTILIKATCEPTATGASVRWLVVSLMMSSRPSDIVEEGAGTGTGSGGGTAGDVDEALVPARWRSGRD